MTTKAFANDMVRMGRELGHVEGLKRAIDILRKHGVDVMHPARVEIYNALMDGPPVAPTMFATPDEA